MTKKILQNSKQFHQLSNSNPQWILSRRDFLDGCLGCAVSAIGLSALGPAIASAAEVANMQKDYGKAKLRIIFTHEPKDRATWPNIGYDYEGRKKQLLSKLTGSCPQLEFLSATAQNAEDAKKILETDKDIDGFVVYMIGIWTGAPQVIASSGKPVIFVDDLYGGSGEFLVDYSEAKKNGLKVAAVSSSNFNDVVKAVNIFECLKKLRSSVILSVGGGWGNSPESIENVFGTKVKFIPFEELDALYKKADRKEAKKWASRWIKNARKVLEPSKEVIEDSATMYLAMKQLMEQNAAEAITVNCLGGFYGGKILAYPCLGFCQFNNDLKVGACESDLTSTLTMLIMTYLTGRPGYISDPVIDTSKNQIIYAHCVAPTKVFGPDGRSNPYHIRSHSEDRKGAALRSLLPLGEIVTTLEFNCDKRQVLLHMAKTEANIDEDKACRTKLAAQPIGDINKLMNYWNEWGWHRVTVFGDHKRSVENLAALLGFGVVEEA